MKFVLAFYGTRGDVEPSVAVGRELLRRGHDVCMAVPPDLIGFAGAGSELHMTGIRPRLNFVGPREAAHCRRRKFPSRLSAASARMRDRGQF